MNETRPQNPVFEKIAERSKKTLLSVGLDPVYNLIPNEIKPSSAQTFPFMHERVISRFLTEIIDATAEHTAIFKPNYAFFKDKDTLKQTSRYIHQRHKDIPVLVDAKVGDVSNTSREYANYLFDYIGADAITVNPYMGKRSLMPFLDRVNRAVFAVVRTSEEGSNEFQDVGIPNMDISLAFLGNTIPLYAHMAREISKDWTENGNVGIVVGATNSDALTMARFMAGNEMWILSPGVGGQGASVEDAVNSGLNEENLSNILINASRSITYSSAGIDYAKAAGLEAEKLCREINRVRFDDSYYKR